VNDVARILVGAILGAAVVWGCVTLWGLFSVWFSPWSVEWWRHHVQVALIGREILAVVPCVVGLGLAFRKLYRSRPVLSALASMAVALPVAYADVFSTPDLIGPLIRLTWGVLLSFLVGPALIVYVGGAVRSNNR
jgi:hypothetical protein